MTTTKVTIPKGDDTDAFGFNDWCKLTLVFEDPTWQTQFLAQLGKIELKISNDVIKTYENPTFPLALKLTAEETRKLLTVNRAKLCCYDTNGKRFTPDCDLEIDTTPDVMARNNDNNQSNGNC